MPPFFGARYGQNMKFIDLWLIFGNLFPTIQFYVKKTHESQKYKWYWLSNFTSQHSWKVPVPQIHWLESPVFYRYIGKTSTHRCHWAIDLTEIILWWIQSSLCSNCGPLFFIESWQVFIVIEIPHAETITIHEWHHEMCQCPQFHVNYFSAANDIGIQSTRGK